jgi:hypothetical protein
MYALTNSAHVWKQMADANERSARLMTRACAGLVLLLLLACGYAVSAELRYGRLCATIDAEAFTAKAVEAREFGRMFVTTHCG